MVCGLAPSTGVYYTDSREPGHEPPGKDNGTRCKWRLL